MRWIFREVKFYLAFLIFRKKDFNIFEYFLKRVYMYNPGNPHSGSVMITTSSCLLLSLVGQEYVTEGGTSEQWSSNFSSIKVTWRWHGNSQMQCTWCLVLSSGVAQELAFLLPSADATGLGAAGPQSFIFLLRHRTFQNVMKAVGVCS